MKTRKLVFTASTLVLAALLCQPVRAGEATVVADGATEFRKSGENAVFSSLSLKLKITADEAAQVRSVLATVTSAVDETGQSLVNFRSSFLDWDDVHRRADKKSIAADVDLKSPARAVKTVREVTGKIELYAPARDPKSVVTITDIGAHVGQILADPTLKAAGLQIAYLNKEQLAVFQKAKAAKPTPKGAQQLDADTKLALIEVLTGGKNTLAFEITDPRGRLVDIEVETAGGQPLDDKFSSKDDEFVSYQFSDKIPKGARIKIYVATPKSVTKIPFKLTDVPLP